ncbi:MAG: sporulation stage III protein AG [Tissierellaceae bacterium]|nr:sporulation stage III protein AG [Tissierellaceae bacterium]
MSDLINRIKNHLENVNNKKFINNLLIILVVSIIFLIVSKKIVGPKENVMDNSINSFSNEILRDLEEDYSEYLEKKLANTLEKIEGVGEVNVMITLENSIEKVTAANTTQISESVIENDSEGGTRESNREDLTTQVLTKGSDGSLLVVKEIKPSINGVIVIAQGADEPVIKEIIYEAVKTVLGIKGNKVQVYSGK